MYGAILGDMIGAPYEFDRGNKTKHFPLFGRGSEFTDDSVMTIAVAEALMDIMWRPASRQCRKLSPHSWKERTLRM